VDERQRWNERYTAAGIRGGPFWFLSRQLDLLPRSGRALDVAGGSGGEACLLAGHGLDVTLVDVSDVALELAGQRAAELGVELDLVRADLTVDPLPGGPWDVVTCLHYLQRDLFPVMAEALAPGGWLVVVLATTTNLERHERPSRRFLLEPHELGSLISDLPVDVVHLEESWADRHEARLVARRPTVRPTGEETP